MSTRQNNTALRSFAQAQERLHCGRTKIYDLVRVGDLELVKLGRKSLISERSIQTLETALLKMKKRRKADDPAAGRPTD